jgi:hypothetical protein
MKKETKKEKFKSFKFGTFLYFLFVLTLLFAVAQAENDIILFDTINSTYAGGLLVYSERNLDTITYNQYNGSSFTVQQTGPDVGGDTSWVRVVGNHERDEMVVISQENTNNDVNALIYYPSNNTFNNLNEISSDVPNSAYRAFDVAIEEISGDVLVVYENSATDDNFIQYRIWNGSGWSSEFNISHNLVEAIGWVKLTSRPRTDQIMLMLMDGEGNDVADIYAVPWDGTQFLTANGNILTTTATDVGSQHFDFAWEISSGEGLAVYGEGNDLNIKRYDSSCPLSTCWDVSALYSISQGTHDVDQLSMCSESSSDHIGLIWGDTGQDVNVSMWNGSQILPSAPTHDAGSQDSGTEAKNVDCGWYNGSSALFIYVDTAGSEEQGINYFNFTKANTWSITDLPSAPNTGSVLGQTNRNQFISAKHPTRNELAIVVGDNGEDVEFFFWNGTAIVEVDESPLEDNWEPANGAQTAAWFDYYRYDPLPNVTTLAPDNLDRELDSEIVINVTVTDNIEIDTVLANITLPNSSTFQLTLVNSTGNSTFYNNTFLNTGQHGVYTLRIFANDTSTHENVNSSETVNFNVGDYISPNVTNVTPVKGTFFGINQFINITANVTDAIGNVSAVIANVTFPNSSIFQVTLINFTSSTFNGSFNANINGTYNVIIIANDTVNNVNASETTSFTVGDNFFPNVTNVLPTAGTNFFNTNQLVNISANVSEEVALSTVSANITFPNGSSILYSMDNRSLRNFNFTFNATDNVGRYNVTIIATDTSSHVNNTETTYFTVGDVFLPTMTLSNPLNASNTTASEILFNFTAFDDRDSSFNCSLILDNLLNQTNTTAFNNTLTKFNVTGFLNGNHEWYIECRDAQDNTNTSTTRNFNVDYLAPQFVSLTVSPSAAADLDPNKNITVNANVTENVTTVSTVILQYKLTNDTTYVNVTTNLNSLDGLYNASFNATQNGTYNIRLFANDSLNNRAYGPITNVTVQFDRTWLVTPATISATVALNNNVTLGNITVNNSGDVDLEFNFSSDSNQTTYNISTNFNLSAGQVRHFQVYENGSVAGVKQIVINFTVNDSLADPKSDTVNGNVVVAPNQPVLLTKFTTPSTGSLTATLGDTIELVADLENIGDGNASNASLFFTVPEQWTVTFGSLTTEFSEFNSGDLESSTVRVNVPTNFTTGEHLVSVNVTAINASGYNLTTANLTFGESIVVDVISPSTVGASSGGGGTSSTTGTSGAATGVSSGGGGTASKADKPITIPEEIYRVLRGTEQTIPVLVTNTFPDTILNDVTLELEGFLAKHITITPKTLDNLGYQRGDNFIMTIFVPEYFEDSQYEVTAKITGTLVASDPDTSDYKTMKLTEVRNFVLKVDSISDATIHLDLEETKKLIQEMKDQGLVTLQVDNLLARAEELIAKKEFVKARELLEEISIQKEAAFSTLEILEELKANIAKAKEKWLDVPQTENSLNLISLALQRGDFIGALERAKNAQLLYVLETKGKLNLFRFLIDWWWAILLGALAFGIISFFVYKASVIFIIDERLKNLNKEELTIQDLMGKTQKKYVVAKEISSGQYERYIKQYEKRITKIRQLRVKLRNKRVAILKTSQELKNVGKEKKELTELIRKVQKEYFVQNKLSRSKFTDRYEQYKTRMAEIEQEETLLEERLQKEKSSGKYKVMTFADKIVGGIELFLSKIKTKFTRKKSKKVEEELAPNAYKSEKNEKGKQQPNEQDSSENGSGTINENHKDTEEEKKHRKSWFSTIFRPNFKFNKRIFKHKLHNSETQRANNIWYELQVPESLAWKVFIEKTNLILPVINQGVMGKVLENQIVPFTTKKQKLPGKNPRVENKVLGQERLSEKVLLEKFPGAFEDFKAKQIKNE